MKEKPPEKYEDTRENKRLYNQQYYLNIKTKLKLLDQMGLETCV